MNEVKTMSNFDWVIRNANVIDGTGKPPFQADFGITGDTIQAVDTLNEQQGRSVLDAAGLCVAPGFIDIHTHSDGVIFTCPTADSRVRQGVTTEITGNCGFSAAPLSGPSAEERRKELLKETDAPATWTDVASYFKQWEETGASLNHALLLGQGTIRQNIAGLEDRPLTDEEHKILIQTIEEGVRQGAMGISTGLEYTPGCYTSTDEIVSIARIAAKYDGLYATHMRDEEDGLLEAIAEAIDIGRRAEIPVQISHFKACGRANWDKQGKAIELIETARKSGVDVMADAYPYTAFSTDLTILLPTWAREGGAEAIIKRLHDPTDRKRILKELDQNVQSSTGDYSRIIIGSVQSSQNQYAVGKTAEEIAALQNEDPAVTIARLIEQEKADVSFIGHGMSEENVERVLSHPQVMIGSDGSSMKPVGKTAETKPHPRSYGTFARVLGYYSRERGLFDLPTAVKKMTSMPASRVGMKDRGRIAPGMKADLTLFDPKTVIDRATFQNPHQYPTGISHVMVNGQFVIKDGKHTNARPGRVIV